MAKRNRPIYRVVKAFDFAPKGNIVIALKEGDERDNLTRAHIKKGLDLNALEPVKQKD